MFHQVARGAHRQRLWSSWAEGRGLWDRVVRACPGLVALVLMPDHLHLVHPDDMRSPLARALSGHTRATNGPGVERLPQAERLADRQKVRRGVRYVHLNPCRAGLATDPLAWPFSTHLDACGLAVRPVVRPRSDAVRFHQYVSGDPHVHVDGTELPGGQVGRVPPGAVLDAVSALTRSPVEVLRRRGPARSLYLSVAVDVCDATLDEIGVLVSASRSAACRATAPAVAARQVRRVLGDPRFTALAGRLPGARR